MINFHEVKDDSDLKLIENMANTIWHEHYTPIIGAEQVKYMLDKFQSAQTMRDQINKGYQYFLINSNENAVGYLSFEKRKNALFLSKIYLLKSERGKGIGRKAMEFVTSVAKGFNCTKVTLTVNRFNQNSIRAYESAGFEKKGALVQDIGNGFVMDDYLMEKPL
ncbi:GNAT family N-acetyltransferase [Lutimonas sp.]|uniref:GNAT family N-acetyltransferase n=1 Tax=Lutimonas sp. TaxID=1872403 RepID=UPI003C723500